ncbi:MAG: hypothetical protein AABZ28_08935, partial [Nitrospinota bacterium]
DTICDYFETDYLKVKDEFSVYLRSTDHSNLKHGFTNILKEGKRKLKKKKLILFIDEFQDIIKTFEYASSKKVSNPLNPEFVRFIGSLVKERVLELIICCRYNIFRLDKEYDLQLLKLMTEIWLGVLDESSAKELIQHPVNSVVKYDPQAINEILILTGCHPYLIQYLCYELIESKRGKQALIKQPDVEYISKKIMTESFREPKFRVLYDDFQQIDNARPWELLLILAHYSEKIRQSILWDELTKKFRTDFSRKASDYNIQNYIEVLTNSRIVAEEKTNGKLHYYILPDILRRWLRIQNYYQKYLLKIESTAKKFKEEG